jgi:hypothetical protein
MEMGMQKRFRSLPIDLILWLQRRIRAIVPGIRGIWGGFAVELPASRVALKSGTFSNTES